MDWSFQFSDLEKLKDKVAEREKIVLFYPNYSLTSREYQIYQRNRVIGKMIESLLKDKDKTTRFLAALNSGNFQFYPGKPLYILDPYYGKSRPTLDLETKEPVLKLYRHLKKGEWPPLTLTERKILINYIALSLIAEKLKGSLPAGERAPVRKRALKELIGYLEKHRGERLLILRGDFKDYTLNIPREVLMEVLKRRGVSTAILKLIEGYFQQENRLSKTLRKGNLPGLFNKVGYRSRFEGDAHLKSFANIDGILPGTPLSNTLGQIFLLDFDQKLREIVGEEGFTVRFLDDFLVIKPVDPEEYQEEMRGTVLQIGRFLSRHYRVPIRKLKQLVRIEEVNRELEFLGYSIEFSGKKVKSRVRYKTLKKFGLKYLSTYQLPFLTLHQLPKSKKIETVGHYWGAKLLYLYSWMDSFYFVNDPKLLDQIYRQIILPDLYATVKRLGVLPQTSSQWDQFQQLKARLRLTTIHRLLKKFQRLEKEQEGFSKRDQILKIAEEFATDWHSYLKNF